METFESGNDTPAVVPTMQGTNPPSSIHASPIFLIVELCLLSLLLVGNSTVCWIIFHNDNLRNKANVFVGVLAGADLCFGLFTLPLCVAAFFVPWYRNPTLCAFSGAINTIFPSAANITLCLLSIDRLVFICHPMRYPEFCKLSLSKLGVAYIGIHALFFATLPPLWGWGRYINNPALRTCVLDLSTNHTFGYIALLYGYLLPSFIVLICYYRVYRAARLQVIKVRSEAAFFHQKPTVRRVLQDTKRGFRHTSKTLILMIMLHTICWVPFLVIHIRSLQFPTPKPPESTAAYVSWLFILTNTSLEPWIYGMYNHTFRKIVTRVLTCCRFKKQMACFRLLKKKTRSYKVGPYI